MKKYTITEAKAELRALKACSANEITTNYYNWKLTYIERLQNTTGKVREVYSQCLDVLEEMNTETNR